MSLRTDAHDLDAMAAKVLSSLASHRQIPVFSRSPGGLSVPDAYRLTPLLRSAFEARGEIITGRNDQSRSAESRRAADRGRV